MNALPSRLPLQSLFAMLALLLLSGCGGSGDNALIVGTEPTYPPFEMTDDTGAIIGFDIDLLTAIAADQGLEIEFRDMDFDSIIPALQAGNIDIAASGLSITPARQQQVLFTDPYIEAGLVIAVTMKNAHVSGPDDLRGLTVVVQQGTTGAAKAEELKAEGKIGKIKYFPNVSVAVMELVNGGADALINDKPVTQAFVSKQPDKLKIVGETLVSDEYGFAVAKANTDLAAKLNAGLTKVKAEGLIEELSEKYFEKAPGHP
ncbi:basic amino acid ABC transporter substrate-binding protein [Pelagicoccus sp. SDUM812003]|uniref:basic amino acid ABC transporter substrate-binding protein n=1 Tax=Pelagicoccus sp. SDUM812003 TaxID=3041267 RepID=UPI00280D0ECC|nr:basic amino acid ABC transporter substrate-binding protein [Pelagicoccus sp. SDUM812003]MDQ8203840.1 basic amino acid ABC transporter substrate-binding protein [Pelagicoccus sp. SDUM812003]